MTWRGLSLIILTGILLLPVSILQAQTISSTPAQNGVANLEDLLALQDYLRQAAERGKQQMQAWLDLCSADGNVLCRQQVIARGLPAGSSNGVPAPASVRSITSLDGYVGNPAAQLWASWIYTPIVSRILYGLTYPGTQI